MPVIEILNDDQFKQVVSDTTSQLVIIDFYATWCGPCKAFAPTYEELSSSYPHVKFYKFCHGMNTEETFETFEITNFPSFFFFRNGNVVNILTGTAGVKEAIIDFIENNS